MRIRVLRSGPIHSIGVYQRNADERLSANNTVDEEVVLVGKGLSLATEVSEGGRGGGDSSGEKRIALTGRILAGLGDPELAAAARLARTRLTAPTSLKMWSKKVLEKGATGSKEGHKRGDF